MHFLNALRWTEETFTKYLLRLPQQHTGIHICVGPALPRFTPFGAMEGGGPVTAWFSVLTDVHLLPENGVLQERGQQTGSEVNVRVHARNRNSGYIGLHLVRPRCNALEWLERLVPESFIKSPLKF